AFRWHALVDYPWGELVKEWLAAQAAVKVGNFGPLVIFFQKRCALMRSEHTVQDTDLPFTRIQMVDTDPKAKAWPGEVMRFLTADRQEEEMYYVTVRAWARGTGESRRLWWGKLYGETAIEELRERYAVPQNCVVVDSGHWAKRSEEHTSE